MKEELKSLRENNTWTQIPWSKIEKGRKAIGNKWVFKKKENPDGSIRFKARLVIKGYEQRYGDDYWETYAATCTYSSIRALIASTAALELKLWQFDVKTAFLNAELNETIYIVQPDSFLNSLNDVL